MNQQQKLNPSEMAAVQDNRRISSRGSKKSIAPITATSRLRNDYVRLMKDPVPYIVAEPLPSNILEWHYVVTGPPDSPYTGGFYHGKLVFPSEFPFKPPSIYMTTPSGRFKTNTRLCLSISDYHPDTWNPAWSVGTILTGLLSFMLEKSPTLGSIETSEAVKRRFAVATHEFNLQNKVYQELFPGMAKKSREFINRTNQRRSSGQIGDSNSSSADGDPLEVSRRQLEQNEIVGGQGFYGAVTNFLVIGGFAAFAFVVQYVIQSLTIAD